MTILLQLPEVHYNALGNGDKIVFSLLLQVIFVII